MSYVQTFRNEKIVEIETNRGKLYFAIGTLPSGEAFRVQLLLQKIMGPAFVALAGSGDPKELLKDSNTQFMLMKLFQEMHLHEEDCKWIFNKFDAVTKVSEDGSTFNFMKPTGPNSRDELFSGRHEVLYKWFYEHLKHNYQSFLDFVKSVAHGGGQNQVPQKAAE